jgi:hypothetical protein
VAASGHVDRRSKQHPFTRRTWLFHNRLWLQWCFIVVPSSGALAFSHLFHNGNWSSISDHLALCLVLYLHACCLSIHLCHLCRRGTLVPRRALAPPLLSSSSLVLVLRALHLAPLVSFRCAPSASRDQWGIWGARHLCTVAQRDRNHTNRTDISSPSCCVSAHNAAQADRNRDHSVDMRVASLRGRYADTDNHLR